MSKVHIKFNKNISKYQQELKYLASLGLVNNKEIHGGKYGFIVEVTMKIEVSFVLLL